MIDILESYIDLSAEHLEKFAGFEPIFREWNQKINLISRKDIDNFYPHHVLHSLSINRVVSFKNNAEILDLGTGGGFPGIPLAISNPQALFTLVDGKKKKIMVVNEVIHALKVENARGLAIRAEDLNRRYDFVVCRAVASIDKLFEWSKSLIKQKQIHAMPNGLICLKGGVKQLEEEIKLLPKHTYVEIFPLKKWYNLPYFEEKFIVYVQS